MGSPTIRYPPLAKLQCPRQFGGRSVGADPHDVLGQGGVGMGCNQRPVEVVFRFSFSIRIARARMLLLLLLI